MDSTARLRDFQDAFAAGVRVVRLGSCCGAQDFRYLVDTNWGNYRFDVAERDALKQSIDRAAAAGLCVILTFVNLPGRNFQEKDTRMWNSPFRERVVALWADVADFVKDNPAVIGFDLLDEASLESEFGDSTISEPTLSSRRSLYHEPMTNISSLRVHTGEHRRLCHRWIRPSSTTH
jgi:aryl-phospho-beta-D-glucosidase BglC (GH1 family)